jgi:hypothetical protein
MTQEEIDAEAARRLLNEPHGWVFERVVQHSETYWDRIYICCKCGEEWREAWKIQ